MFFRLGLNWMFQGIAENISPNVVAPQVVAHPDSTQIGHIPEAARILKVFTERKS